MVANISLEAFQTIAAQRTVHDLLERI
jgi:hypothetical protein